MSAHRTAAGKDKWLCTVVLYTEAFHTACDRPLRSALGKRSRRTDRRPAVSAERSHNARDTRWNTCQEYTRIPAAQRRRPAPETASHTGPMHGALAFYPSVPARRAVVLSVYRECQFPLKQFYAPGSLS